MRGVFQKDSAAKARKHWRNFAVHFVGPCTSAKKQQQKQGFTRNSTNSYYRSPAFPTGLCRLSRMRQKGWDCAITVSSELSKRCEEQGLIRRTQNTHDRRFVELQVTSQGGQLLQSLSLDHEHELYELAPQLIAALTQIRAFQGAKRPRVARDARERGVTVEV